VLAVANGQFSAPVHAPTSGHVVDFVDHAAPHASGLTQRTIMLRSDGLDEWGELPAGLEDPFTATPDEIAARVAAAGIVGQGGAAFPSSVKLKPPANQPVTMLLLNGAECEPYLTCDDRIMREHAAEVIDGARIMAYALAAPKIVVAIEANKPQALATMAAAAAPFGIEVVQVPVQYPMGSERHLAKAVTGQETPAKMQPSSIGVVVHNIGTARAVHQAIRFGRPLISRVVTVSGGGIAQGQNVEVRLGTLVSELVAFCGGFTDQHMPACVISGGPMMGTPLPSLDVPVVKGTCAILSLTAAEINEQAPGACVRCGACVTACPCGLMPFEMAAYIRKDMLDGATRVGVRDCVSCGSCSYTCPSHIPLVQYFNYAKGRLNSLDRERQKQERLRTLAEARQARLERVARTKREAAAARSKPLSDPTADTKASA
jgi:electron transport complex protein RnfC